MRRYGDSRDWDRTNERDRSRDRKRDRSRDRARDHDRSLRSPNYEPERCDEGQGDTSVLAWIPSEDIRYDVISEDLPIYMGAGSTVERGNHPKDGRPGYFVRGPFTLTVSMISDLKRDTIDWQDESAKTGNWDYRKSATHRRRQGPTRPLPIPRTFMTKPPQRVDSMPFSPARHDRSDDPRENYTDVSGAQSPLGYVPERASSLNQISSQGGFAEPPRSTGLHSRHQTTGTTAHGQERQPSAYPSVPTTDNTQNTGVSRNPSASASQPGSQTNPTKEDLRKAIARKLQDEGRSKISTSEFDRVVDEAWQKLQQRQTSGQAAPPPYTKLVEQPSTTDNRGFHIPATAGPKPGASYPQYQYQR